MRSHSTMSAIERIAGKQRRLQPALPRHAACCETHAFKRRASAAPRTIASGAKAGGGASEFPNFRSPTQLVLRGLGISHAGAGCCSQGRAATFYRPETCSNWMKISRHVAPWRVRARRKPDPQPVRRVQGCCRPAARDRRALSPPNRGSRAARLRLGRVRRSFSEAQPAV